MDTATVIYGLDVPWEVQYGPDDHLWVTERYGLVSRVNLETGEKTVILDLTSTVYTFAECGLLGMVLHPYFETEPYVYLAYTYEEEESVVEKIVRYTYSGGQLGDPYTLLDDIPGQNVHNGCRLVITPDLKLMASTGDAKLENDAQNIESLNGKILRMNLDGSFPEDNPFPDSPVYSFGHRNPQGLFYAANGLLYSSEHGPSTDDEVNLIEAGRNYGWPQVNGFCDLPDEITFCEANDVAEPLAAWTPTVAASDIVVYDHPAIPEFEGSILFSTLKNKRLYVLELDDSGTSVLGEEQYFNNYWGRLRDVCLGPDGAIYLATNGPDWSNSTPFTHRIIKVWNPEYISTAEGLQKAAPSVALYPNPARETIRITVEKGFLGEKVKLVSASGIRVGEYLITGLETMIDVSHLDGGLYFVLIAGEIGYAGKLLVE